MIIETGRNIRVVEKIAEKLNSIGLDLHSYVKVMRKDNKNFVIAIVNFEINKEVFHGIYGIVSIKSSNEFFVDNYEKFLEYWEFLEQFDNQRKLVNA